MVRDQSPSPVQLQSVELGVASLFNCSIRRNLRIQVLLGRESLAIGLCLL